MQCFIHNLIDFVRLMLETRSVKHVVWSACALSEMTDKMAAAEVCRLGTEYLKMNGAQQ